MNPIASRLSKLVLKGESEREVVDAEETTMSCHKLADMVVV